MTATTVPTLTTESRVGTGSARIAPYRAEWAKLRSLRTTWATLVGSGVFAIVLAVLASASQIKDWAEMSPAERASFDPASTALIGVLFTTVIIGSLGVRSITAEYSTGMIRTTFSAIPHRRRVLAAKAALLAIVAFPAALATNVVAFAAGQLVLAGEDANASLTDGGVPTAIVFGAVAVSATAIMGVGLGALLKRAASATTLLAVAIVGSQLFAVGLPESARRFLPGSALQATVSVKPADDLLGPGAGLAVLAIYAALALALSLLLVTRKDA